MSLSCTVEVVCKGSCSVMIRASSREHQFSDVNGRRAPRDANFVWRDVDGRSLLRLS